MDSSNQPRSTAKSQSHSFSSTLHEDRDFDAANSELHSPLLTYTTLKDLLPSSPRLRWCSSPKASAIQSAYEIPISNLLVQKAARAYLQPAMPESRDVLPRFSSKLLFVHLKIFGSRLVTAIRRVFGRLLGAINGA